MFDLYTLYLSHPHELEKCLQTLLDTTWGQNAPWWRTAALERALKLHFLPLSSSLFLTWLVGFLLKQKYGMLRNNDFILCTHRVKSKLSTKAYQNPFTKNYLASPMHKPIPMNPLL